MTSSLQKIADSKRELRRELASLPVAEKLRMLVAMREREVAIRQVANAYSADRARVLTHHDRHLVPSPARPRRGWFGGRARGAREREATECPSTRKVACPLFAPLTIH